MNKLNNETIIERLHNIQLILNDNEVFLYTNSERQSDIKKYSLGDGSITAAISLFSLLGLISKIYNILKNGEKNLVTNNDINKYNDGKQKLKDMGIWSEIKDFYKKPRLGEINETDSFVELIQDCPIDIGINKTNPTEIKEVWGLFRNKLIHMLSLAGDNINGQMLIQVYFGNGLEGDYAIASKFLERRSLGQYKSFNITTEKVKEIFSNSNIASNIAINDIQYILKDKVYVSTLNIQCKHIFERLIEKINGNYFDEKNTSILVDWLTQELKT